MTFQLRIAGAPDATVKAHAFTMLTPQAVEMADRGYGCVLIDGTAPSLGLEVRKRNGVIEISRFNNTTIAEVPDWVGRAEADLTHQANRLQL